MSDQLAEVIDLNHERLKRYPVTAESTAHDVARLAVTTLYLEARRRRIKPTRAQYINQIDRLLQDAADRAQHMLADE